jgi:TPR repeat protein
MGLLQKIFNLVKEELSNSDAPKRETSKKLTVKKQAESQPKRDSFEQLCAKAKSGDLAAQFNLFDQYAEKLEKRAALETLFTKIMNDGNIEGKALLGCLLLQPGTSKDEQEKGMKLYSEATAAKSLFALAMNGFFYAAPRGKRRDWDPQVSDERLIILPVNIAEATKYLLLVYSYLTNQSREVQAAYHSVYGTLAYAYLFFPPGLHDGFDDPKRKYARIGAEYNDSLACFALARMYQNTLKNEDNSEEYVALYLHKAEKNKEQLDNEIYKPILGWLYSDLGALYWDKDRKKAVKYYEQAAELGIGEAMMTLVGLYESGKTITKDLEKAMYWRNRAADAGWNFSKNCAAEGSI